MIISIIVIIAASFHSLIHPFVNLTAAPIKSEVKYSWPHDKLHDVTTQAVHEVKQVIPLSLIVWLDPD